MRYVLCRMTEFMLQDLAHSDVFANLRLLADRAALGDVGYNYQIYRVQDGAFMYEAVPKGTGQYGKLSVVK